MIIDEKILPKSHEFFDELNICLQAVIEACKVCETVWDTKSQNTILKEDESPVTIADFASQIIIGNAIVQKFPSDVIIAEEDLSKLNTSQIEALKAITNIPTMEPLMPPSSIPDKETTKRFWTIDPIDGTLGYISGGQYACCVALIINGEIVLSIIGCPRLEVDKSFGKGVVFVAIENQGSFVISLQNSHQIKKLPICQEPSSELILAESREKKHTDHDFSDTFMKSAGITQTIRIDSQCKYGLVASGLAHIYLRHSVKKGYQEKIWDHAPGALLVKEAGGVVSDFSGLPLNLLPQPTMSIKGGILATNLGKHQKLSHDKVVEILSSSIAFC